MSDECKTNIVTCSPDCFKGTPLWNIYDTGGSNEHCLYDSLVSEFADISGFPVEYYIASSNMDTLYGEDATQDFLPARKSKLVYEPQEETRIFEAFGMSGDDTLQYAVMPKSLFIRDISEEYEPKPGDVIKTLWNNRNYEIVLVTAEQRIFLANKLVWEFILRPFRFSEQSKMASHIHYSRTSSDGTTSITGQELYPSMVLYPCTTLYPTLEDDVLLPGAEIYPNSISVPGEGYTKEYKGKPYSEDISEEYGDDDFIEDESDEIDDYDDVDTKIFGF